MFSFGKKKEEPKPKTLDQMNSDEIKEFQKQLRTDLRANDREITKQLFNTERLIKESERDLQKKIKEGASRETLRIYAKNVMMAKKARDKHQVCKTQLQSVEMSVNHMIASLKMTKTMGEATNVLAKVNSLMKIPELAATAANLQKQLNHVGIMGEMMDDAMDGLDNEIDADEDVDAFLDEMTKETEQKKIKKTTNKQGEVNELDDLIKNLL